MVRQLGEHNCVVVSFPVLGISELTKEKTEERTDNSWREKYLQNVGNGNGNIFFFLKKRNGRNDVVFGQEEGQSLGLHVV